MPIHVVAQPHFVAEMVGNALLVTGPKGYMDERFRGILGQVCFGEFQGIPALRTVITRLLQEAEVDYLRWRHNRLGKYTEGMTYTREVD